MAILLTACSPPVRWEKSPPAPRPVATLPADRVHVVRAGETLYGIARRYGLEPAALARWNRLGDGSIIQVGQRLRLSPPDGAPGSAPTAPAIVTVPPPAWRWPTDGTVLRAYGATGQTTSGIHIGGRAGQPVVAAADGQVVYSGNGLVGYGELLIVKHSESWLTAYGYNAQLLVKEGDRVLAGQVIARMGEGPGRTPALHFEIRRNGIPVDPLGELPAR